MKKLVKRKQSTEQSWCSIHIPLSQIEDVYGHGNFDDAGDALADAVSKVHSSDPKTYQVRFEFDTNHSNRWFHALIFRVSGLTANELSMLADRIRGLLLWPEAAVGWDREPSIKPI